MSAAMEAWKNSPVATALHAVLLACRPGEVARRAVEAEKEVAVFSYREDFLALWALVKKADSLYNGTHHLVVVWDGAPEDKGRSPANVADRVTAFDWLVALALRLAEEKKRRPALHVSLLDLASPHHPGAFAVRVDGMWRPALPWVCVYTPADFNKPGHPDLLTDLGIGVDPLPPLKAEDHTRRSQDRLPLYDTTVDAAAIERVDYLRQFWAADLTRAETRHDVSNVIGPLVLAQGLKAIPEEQTRLINERVQHKGDEADRLQLAYWQQVAEQAAQLLDSLTANRPLRQALETFLGALGLFQKVDGGRKTDEPFSFLEEDSLLKHDIFGRFQRHGHRPVHVLLVDDDAAEGYADVVRDLLGSKTADGKGDSIPEDAPFVLTSETKPDELLNLLDLVPGPDPSDPAPANERVRQTWGEPRVLGRADDAPDNLAPFDVLLLDLRLFNGETEKEASFLIALTALYDEKGAGHLDDVHLRAAYDAATIRLEALADSGKKRNAPELGHLALLPLLLSHADPSLPIVLFSSTRQRKLLEAFAHRPNIVTTFSKPIVSGNTEGDTPADAVRSLHRALRRALELHECRVVWECLPGLKWAMPWPCFTARKSLSPDRTQGYVYNLPQGQNPREDFLRVEKPVEPRLLDEELSTRLAEMYVEYVLRGLDYYFTSVPWELLEGCFMPKDIVASPFDANPGFSFERQFQRNRPALGLKHARHRKVHGQLPRSLRFDQDTDEWRWGSLLELLLLLDFIGGPTLTPTAQATASRPAPVTISDYWHYLRDLHSDLRRRSQDSKPHPGVFTANQQVTWTDSLLYGILFEVPHQAGRTIPISAITSESIHNFARYRLKNFTNGPPPRDPNASHQTVARVEASKTGGTTEDELWQRQLYVALQGTQRGGAEIASYLSHPPCEIHIGSRPEGFFAIVTFNSLAEADQASKNNGRWPPWFRPKKRKPPALRNPR